MQIDFHYAVVYVLARISGYTKDEANVVAGASQYVDDAVWERPIFFKSGEIYKPMASAHKMLDYRNFKELANRLSWVSYHFLPGNCNEKADSLLQRPFEERLICTPNSPLAQDMVEEVLSRRDEALGLYRLGIALHVYADTWAHQGFSGIESRCNRAKLMEDEPVGKSYRDKLSNFFSGIFDNSVGEFLETVMPLGHGAVLGCPDKPYLEWKYLNHQGMEIRRNNTDIFMDAIHHIYPLLFRFKTGCSPAQVNPLPRKAIHRIREVFESNCIADDRQRLQVWLDAIAAHDFGLTGKEAHFHMEGPDTWIRQAFGSQELDEDERYEFSESFEESHWKKFHDALADHHFFMIRVLFPKYRLCIA